MFSVKMRQRKVDRLDNWVSYDSTACQNQQRSYPMAETQTIPMNRRRNHHAFKLKEYRRSRHDKSQPFYNLSEDYNNNNNNNNYNTAQQPAESTAGEVLSDKVELACAGTDDAGGSRINPQIKDSAFNYETTTTAAAAAATTNNNTNIISNHEGFNNNKMILLDNSSRFIGIAEELDLNSWIPDNDGYGIDQQPAIETALSIVLTVSTLVSFRADKSKPNHCCLHHAVQVSYSLHYYCVTYS